MSRAPKRVEADRGVRAVGLDAMDAAVQLFDQQRINQLLPPRRHEFGMPFEQQADALLRRQEIARALQHLPLEPLDIDLDQVGAAHICFAQKRR